MRRARPGRPVRLRRPTSMTIAAAAGSILVPLAASAGAPPPSTPSRTTPPVVVQEVRPGELPEDPSAFTTVIDLDEFAGEAKTVEDVLDESVGVQVRRFGGAGDPSEISIRGSTPSQVVILLDGVRLNSAQTGGVDLSTLPASLIDPIEVSRGGGSVQTGSDAIGGVVNLISVRPGGEPTTTLELRGGSFGTWNGSVTRTATWRGLEMALGYAGFHTDGDWEFRPVERVDEAAEDAPDGPYERVNNDSTSHSVLVSLGHDLGDKSRLSFRDSFLWNEAGRPGPDALGFGELQGQSLTAEQLRVRNVASAVFETVDLGTPNLDANAQVFHRWDRSRYRDPMPTFLAPIDSDNRNQSVGTRAGLSYAAPLGWTQHALSGGTELRYDLLDAKDMRDRSRRTVGVFLQDEVRFLAGRVRVIPAVRFDDTEGFDGEWMPRVGAIVRLLPWLEIKSNVERAYRVPNFDELYFDEGTIRGNPNLAPEDSLDYDVGFAVTWERLWFVRDTWLEFALFRREIEDSIQFQVINNGVVAAANTGEATIEGLELSGGIGLFDWLRFSGNWTLLDAEEDATGAPLPGRADSEYLLRLEVGPGDRSVRIVVERSHTSAIPVTTSGRTRLVDRRTLYNATFAVDVAQLPWFDEWIPGRMLLVSVTGRNLTDASVRDALFYPQPGRTLTFGVRWER